MSSGIVWHEGEVLGLTQIAPLDLSDPGSPALPGALTQAGFLFYEKIATRTTGDQDGNNIVPIEAVGDFKVGDIVEIIDANKIRREGTIGHIESATSMQLTGDIGGVLEAGARVIRKVLTGSIAGALFGTPVLNQTDWGYVVFYPHTTAGIFDREPLLAELTLDDGGVVHHEQAVSIRRSSLERPDIS